VQAGMARAVRHAGAAVPAADETPVKPSLPVAGHVVPPPSAAPLPQPAASARRTAKDTPDADGDAAGISSSETAGRGRMS
jgi:hypothetical protein